MRISSGFIQSMNRSKCKIEMLFNPNIITAKMKKWVWNLLFSLYITSFFLIYIQLFENHRTPFFTNNNTKNSTNQLLSNQVQWHLVLLCSFAKDDSCCWFWIYRQWQDEILHIYTAFEFHLSKHGESGMEFGVQLRELKRNEKI